LAEYIADPKQSGAVAGTTVDLSLFPLDTLKTRLQSSAGFFQSGGFNGIYRGVGSAIVGSAPGAALFFVTYDSTKRALLRYASSNESAAHARTATGQRIDAARAVDPRTAALIHMLAGSLGEMAACIVRVPTEVVKQRAQAVQHPSSAASLMHILRSNSGIGLVRELYRGGGITLLREIPFTIIQFPLWEAMKAWHARKFLQSTTSSLGPLSGSKDGATTSLEAANSIPALPAALYGSASGAIAAAVTTPLDVLKTRLMLSRERVGAITMMRQILRDSGTGALFAGIAPRVMWISIGGAVFLGSYQWASNMLRDRAEE
jgi:solute carrier family 25 S-adenosylmethionine transporter 26